MTCCENGALQMLHHKQPNQEETVMNRDTVFSKASFVFLILVLFLAVASLGTVGCAEDAASGGASASIEGVWTGATAGASSSNITLTVRPNERKLRYGSPRSCELGLEEPSTPDGSTQKFGIISSTGGRCDVFLVGKLTVRPEGEKGDLTYEVTDSNSKVVENGQLHRSGR